MKTPLSDMADVDLAELAARPADHPGYSASLSLGAREELAMRAAMAERARAVLSIRTQR